MLTIVTGGNDCDSKTPADAVKIVSEYKELIQSALSKASSITVSSVCPRLTSTQTQETIEAVNAGLVAVCNEHEAVTFTDNTPSFKLCDGSINDGYLLQDGVHVTRGAKNKIARNLKLCVLDDNRGVCKSKAPNSNKHKLIGSNYRNMEKQQTAEKIGTYRNSLSRNSKMRELISPEGPNNTRRVHGNQVNHHSRNSWIGRGHRGTSRTQSQQSVCCDYCGEEGHLKDRCYHGKVVTCFSCHQEGLKERLCHLYHQEPGKERVAGDACHIINIASNHGQVKRLSADSSHTPSADNLQYSIIDIKCHQDNSLYWGNINNDTCSVIDQPTTNELGYVCDDVDANMNILSDDLNSFFSANRFNLKIGHLNINSIRHKFQLLSQLLYKSIMSCSYRRQNLIPLFHQDNSMLIILLSIGKMFLIKVGVLWSLFAVTFLKGGGRN